MLSFLFSLGSSMTMSASVHTLLAAVKGVQVRGICRAIPVASDVSTRGILHSGLLQMLMSPNVAHNWATNYAPGAEFYYGVPYAVRVSSCGNGPGIPTKGAM